MKNSVVLFSRLAIFVVSQFLFSCTSLDVVKRHYKPGYYFDAGTTIKKEKDHIKNPMSKKDDALAFNSKSEDNIEIKDASVIKKEDFFDNYTATINKETPSTKSKSIFSISPPKIINSFVSKQIVTQQKDNSIYPPRHDAGNILSIIGTIAGILGVLIFLASFPANTTGMVLGRLLISLGALAVIIGLFL